MGAMNIINVVLLLLRGVLASAHQQGAGDVVAALQAAIDKLQEVQNTPVSKAQMDSLKISKLW